MEITPITVGKGLSVCLFAPMLNVKDMYSWRNNTSMFSFLVKCKSILSVHIQ